MIFNSILNNNYLYVGSVLYPHGISGAVCIKSYMSNPEDIFLYNPLFTQKKSLYLCRIGRSSNRLIAKIKGVNDRSQAEEFRGLKLYIPKKLLPKINNTDEYYIYDLIGLRVYLKDNSFFGNVKRVEDICSSTVIEISVTKDNNRVIVLPFVKRFIINIDLQNGILIDIPKNFQ